jgi:hypothetical protein
MPFLELETAQDGSAVPPLTVLTQTPPTEAQPATRTDPGGSAPTDEREARTQRQQRAPGATRERTKRKGGRTHPVKRLKCLWTEARNPVVYTRSVRGNSRPAGAVGRLVNVCGDEAGCR